MIRIVHQITNNRHRVLSNLVGLGASAVSFKEEVDIYRTSAQQLVDAQSNVFHFFDKFANPQEAPNKDTKYGLVLVAGKLTPLTIIGFEEETDRLVYRPFIPRSDCLDKIELELMNLTHLLKIADQKLALIVNITDQDLMLEQEAKSLMRQYCH
jgi:hypothetical protein